MQPSQKLPEKTKKNFTALDITAMVADLNDKIVGLRVANIFDINPKTYIFKFSRNEKKECLIIESGLRMHTTASKLEKSKIPSGFTMKFRKFLRAKKLESLRQVGCERVVDMQFGSDNAFHLILEFYAQGNIILTDKDYVILQLIRSHEFSETAKTALGEKYPFHFAAKLSLETFDVSQETIISILDKKPEKTENEALITESNNKATNNNDPKSKKKEKAKPKPQPPPSNTKKWKDVLFQILPCLNPSLTDHLLIIHGVNPNEKCSLQDLEKIHEISISSLNFLKEFSKQKHKGYLVLSMNSSNSKNLEENQEENKENATNEEKKKIEAFVDFAPIALQQFEGKNVKIIESFNEAVDIYFSSMETKSERSEFEQKAWKKFENIKLDQENRLELLKNEQEEFLIKAKLIEKNIQEIEAIIKIIKTMVDSGLSWDKITKMINESKKTGDFLANMIFKTDWELNEVVILLSDPENEDLESPLTPVSINFTVSAYQNAKLYYENKKKHHVKEKKTLEASQQALKLAEKNALQEINKNKDRTDVLNARKVYWFEKFYWFISSENYLVLSGRDGQQNELLVKKYLQKGDIYLHADYHGAASTIVKNPNKDESVPITTLEEAAVYAAARSKAWENKILPGTWWVYDHQVSKSAPSGEYLPTGSFMIRGKKNFLNPPKLELGLGLLFKVDESCLINHQDDRKIKAIEGKEEPILLQKQIFEDKSLEKEEFTLVTMNEMQPRIKNPEKPSKGQNPQKKEKNSDIARNNEKEKGKEESVFDENEQKNKKISINYDQLPRGKKSKLKKMKEKYEDQDEEEREIKMKLIGATEMKINASKKEEKAVEENSKGKQDKKDKKNKGNSKNPKEKNNKNKEKADIKTEIEEKNQKKPPQKQEKKNEQVVEKLEKKPENEKIEPKTIKLEEQASNLQENKTENTETLELLKEIKESLKENDPEEQKETTAAEETKQEEINEDDIEEELERQRIKEEENVTNENQLNLDKTEWNCLIGTPLPEDTYFFIVPVCAPINALQTYKYKVKLVPGTLKKGKAAKTISSLFLSQKDLNPLERKLIKGLSDFDLINDLIGSVKLVGAGLQKIKDQEKKSKKDKKLKDKQ